MSTNYDSTNVGVLYTRCNNITIQYPPNGIPTIVVEQAIAVKLADGTIVEINKLPAFTFTLDMESNATTPIPLVNPTNGANLGVNTNLNQIMLGILAVLRQQQLLQNP